MATAQEQVLQLVIDRTNYAYANATGYEDLAQAAAAQVVSAANAMPGNLQLPDFPITPPVLPGAPSLFDPSNVSFNSADVLQVMANLKGIFNEFYTQNFPEFDFVVSAKAWLQRQISQGGSGINTDVETAIWQRSRARIYRDSIRQEGDVMAGWANNGFEVPPGAMNTGLEKVRSDTAAQIAEVSRTAAIKSFDAELEMTRFAVEQAMDAYFEAYRTSIEYFKAFVPTQNKDIDRARAQIDGKSALLQALTSVYKTQADFQGLAVRIGEAKYQATTRASEVVYKTQAEALRAKVDAATANANSAGNRAAAALNSLGSNISAGISAQA